MRQRLIVLNYHRVPEQPDPLHPEQVDRAVFRAQLSLLNRYFNVVGLSDGVDAMRTGTLPPRAVAITFDDGYRDNHDVALEELKRANCTATFFIATDYIDGGRMWNDTIVESIRLTRHTSLSVSEFGLEGSLELNTTEDRRQAIDRLIPVIKYLPTGEREQAVQRLASLCDVELPDTLMMSSEQLKSLVAAGMEIGGHTSSHPILLRLESEQAEFDIKQGQETLANLLGQPLRFFAYPNGKLNQDFDNTHPKILAQLGFDAAFTTHWGYTDKDMPAYELPRVGFGRNTGLKLALKLLRSYFDTPGPFSSPA